MVDVKATLVSVPWKLLDTCINVFPSFLGLSIAGKANLEKADLEPALKALKDRLMTKNVVWFFFSSMPVPSV